MVTYGEYSTNWNTDGCGLAGEPENEGAAGEAFAKRVYGECAGGSREADDPKTQAEVQQSSPATPVLPETNQEEEEACQAIIALGYKPQWASAAVHKAYKKGMSAEEVIKAVLAAV